MGSGLGKLTKVPASWVSVPGAIHPAPSVHSSLLQPGGTPSAGPTRQGSLQLSSVQLLNRLRLFATPWTAAHQASLSITNSQSLLKLTSIKSVLPSNHLILCCPLLRLQGQISITSDIQMIPLLWQKVKRK